MKRYIYIAAVVIVILVLAGLLFYAISRNQGGATNPFGSTGSLPTTGTQTNPLGSGGGAAPGTGAGTGVGAQVAVKSFGVIAADQAFDYFVDAKNDVFIVKPDGTIEEVTGGQVSPLSSSQINGLIKADFSYDGGKIVVNFGDPSNPQTSVFDVATKAWTPLPQGLISPAFSPSDYRIAYLARNPGGTLTLATFDASSTSKKAPAPISLATINAQDLSLRWFNRGQIILSDKPTVFGTASAWLYDVQKQTLSPLAFEKTGLESIWTGATSSTAAMGLVFTSNDTARGGTLRLNDFSGDTLQGLSISTLPSKCLFNAEIVSSSSASSSTPAAVATTTNATGTKTGAPAPTAASTTTTLFLYCGIPRDQSDFAFSHLPDDYNNHSLYTSDDIYKINALTGEIDIVWNDPTQNLDISDVKFFNGTLFFINRYDQKLYGLIFD